MTLLRASDVGKAALEELAQLLAAAIWLVFAIPLELARAVFCPGRPARKPASIAITGASSGIGAGLAERWAAPGITLALMGRPADAELLKGVVATCVAKGATVSSKSFDVTDRAAVEAWLLAADDAAPVDLVVANAGVSEGTAGLDGSHNIAAAAHAVFAVNVNGVRGCGGGLRWGPDVAEAAAVHPSLTARPPRLQVLNTIFALLPRMRARGRGQIAIMASIAGERSVQRLAMVAGESTVEAR